MVRTQGELLRTDPELSFEKKQFVSVLQQLLISYSNPQDKFIAASSIV